MIPKLADFLSELKRRRVFRVAAVYAGVAFVIIQLADYAFEQFNVSSEFGRFLTIVLALGFLIVIALAWAFDITDEGIVRAKGRPADAKRKAQPLLGNKSLAVIAVLAIAFGVWALLRGPSSSGAIIQSIAVLPLQDLIGDPEQEYFTEGMHEALITELSGISAISVISKQSTLQYKNSEKTMPVIASELGVDALVEGSAQLEGNRVRITAQLIDSQDRHLWRNTFEQDLEDVYALYDEVTRAIAQEIRATLTPEEEVRLTSAPQVNPEAYQLYLQARDLFYSIGGSKEAIEQILDYLIAAVDLDPQFVEAYAFAVFQHMLMYWFAYDPTQQRLDLAKQALDAAILLAPDDPAVLVAEGRYHYHGFRDYVLALRAYMRAVTLAPSNSNAHADIGLIYRRLGDFETALEYLKRGFELNPVSAGLANEIGTTYIALKDLANAQTWYQRSLEVSEEFTDSYYDLALIAFHRTGDTEEALAVLEQGLRFMDIVLPHAWANLEFQAGRYEIALEYAANIPEISLNAQPRALWMGILYDHLGQADSAQHYLSRSLEQLNHQATALGTYTSVAHTYTWLGLTYAYLDSTEEALAASSRADQLLPLSKDALAGVDIQIRRAWIFTVLGHYNEALDILDDLLARRGWFLINNLLYERQWEPLRSHPRYAELVERYREG